MSSRWLVLPWNFYIYIPFFFWVYFLSAVHANKHISCACGSARKLSSKMSVIPVNQDDLSSPNGSSKCAAMAKRLPRLGIQTDCFFLPYSFPISANLCPDLNVIWPICHFLPPLMFHSHVPSAACLFISCYSCGGGTKIRLRDVFFPPWWSPWWISGVVFAVLWSGDWQNYKLDPDQLTSMSLHVIKENGQVIVNHDKQKYKRNVKEHILGKYKRFWQFWKLGS